jgi:hypothetical protein
MGVKVGGQSVPSKHDTRLPCAKERAQGNGIVTRRAGSQRDGLSYSGLAWGRGSDDEVVSRQSVEAKGAAAV